MAEPVVVQGPRGADARGMYRKEQALPVEQIREVAPAAEGEVVFVSPHQMLRLTLWERWDRAYLDAKGRRVPDKREVIFFRGVYRTKDAEEIEALRKATSYNHLFFEQDALVAKAREAKVKAAMAAADDPEIAEALKVKLGAQEMPLPQKAEKADEGDSESAKDEKPKERVKPIK